MKLRFMVILFTLGLFGWNSAQSDLSDDEALEALKKYSYVKIENNSWQPEEFKNATVIPASYVKTPAIILDGKDDESDWSNATEIEIPLSYGLVSKAWLKALYSDEEVFIRVRWEDATENRQHHPWIWDAAQGRYTEGPQIEDALLVSIEGGCDWNASLLANQIYDFDAWVWMAARTNPLGQAVDADGTVSNSWAPRPRSRCVPAPLQPAHSWHLLPDQPHRR